MCASHQQVDSCGRADHNEEVSAVLGSLALGAPCAFTAASYDLATPHPRPPTPPSPPPTTHPLGHPTRPSLPTPVLVFMGSKSGSKPAAALFHAAAPVNAPIFHRQPSPKPAGAGGAPGKRAGQAASTRFSCANSSRGGGGSYSGTHVLLHCSSWRCRRVGTCSGGQQRTRHPVGVLHPGPAAVLCGVAPRKQAAAGREGLDLLQADGPWLVDENRYPAGRCVRLLLTTLACRPF